MLRGLQYSDSSGGEQADHNRLPEGEEDDQFDAEHLQEWLVLGKVLL